MHKDFTIRTAHASDITPFMQMCADVFRATYTNQALNIPSESFRYDLFMSDFNKEYFEDLINGVASTTFLACSGDEIVGGIGVQLIDDYYHIGAFYVSSDYQGMGIGSKLWQKAEEIIGNNTVKLEVISLANIAINMYFKKGFVIDSKNPYLNFSPVWLPGRTYLMYNLVMTKTPQAGHSDVHTS